MNSADALRKLLDRQTTAEVVGQFLAYLKLIEKWNVRINLTGSSEWRILGPLFEEAIWASRFYPLHAVRHLDIGSGAGFPAIPLRILRPKMQLELVEVRSKRAIFLEVVTEQLGLVPVQIHTQRLETFLLDRRDKRFWNVVSWKGIRPSRRETALLLGQTNVSTQFWLFHGRNLPVADQEGFEREVKLHSRETTPYHAFSYLSIYKKLNE